MPQIQELNEVDFQSEVLQSAQPVLVDFWAPWCAPCRMITPILEELAAENDGRIKIVKVNVDQNPSIAAEYGINSIPALLLFDRGEVAESFIGVQPKERLQETVDRIAR